MSAVDLARPEIRDLRAYEAAVQLDDTIRLNANEAPWRSAADGFRRPLNRYPEIRPAGLRAALARRFGCSSERLLVTRGTSEGIDLLIRAFCRPGIDNIVTPTPTFSMYRHYARIQGAAVRELPTSGAENYAVDAGALLADCDANTRLVFLCTPNNPTGTSLPRDTLESIVLALRDKSVVVVDEAYIEFSCEASAVDLLASFDNLVVLRTLSKALAFAGARCGAVMASADVIGMLDAIQAPYALATPVVECVESALEQRSLDDAGQRVADIIAERERLAQRLLDHPVVEHIWPSDANFFLMQVRDIDAVLAQTKADRVLLRYFGNELHRCVRVTIGTRRENEALLASFETLGRRHG